MKYHFFSDAGHGWIKVSIAELEKLGIAGKITGCSYMREGWAYLEEDCDLSTFFKVKNFTDFDKNCKTHYSNHSKIRSYNCYDYDQFLALTKAIHRYNSEETLRKWVNKSLDNKSETNYFKDKTSYDQLSNAAKTWFYNIAKTIQEEAYKAAQEWLKIFEPYDKINPESKLHEKIEGIKKDLEVLIQ